MPSKLFAARYEQTDWPTTVGPVEMFDDVGEDIGLKWAFPGGLRGFEFTIRARSEIDAYDRYENHLGHLMCIFDSYLDRYISGNVYEVVPNGRRVTYRCGSPWRRTNDNLYKVTEYVSDDIDVTVDDTTDVIIDILGDMMAWDSTDTSNMEASGVLAGGWAPNIEDFGTLAADAIVELMRIGKSDGTPMDFYWVEPPFSGAILARPIPYFKARSTTASPDWQFSKDDLISGGFTLSRHVWDLRRNVGVRYGRLSGSVTTADAAAPFVLTDSAASFAGKVSPGDNVINLTQDKEWTVASVASGTTLNMEPPGHAGTLALNDAYSIELTKRIWVTQATSSETDLWHSTQPVFMEQRAEMDQTQAEAYRDQILSTYEKPILQQSFIIGAPRIRDGNGALSPLWRPFFGDSFYFRAFDIFPEAALFTSSDDRSKSFIATSMDYKNGRLRVVPSTGDSRLDVILQQAGLVRNLIISTGESV